MKHSRGQQPSAPWTWIWTRSRHFTHDADRDVPKMLHGQHEGMKSALDLPSGIIIENLPGPKRGEYPALYFRDEIVWSPRKDFFALAYTITEASNGNEVGCLLWAENKNDTSKIMGNIFDGPLASCWRSPWCKWVSQTCFLFKSQLWDGKTVHVPLVAIDVFKGIYVFPRTNDANFWIDDWMEQPLNFAPFSADILRQQILSA